MPAGPKLIRITLPTLGELYGSLPEADRTPPVRDALQAAYDRELQALLHYALAPDCAEPEVILSGWRIAGSQHIAEFAVSDLALPVRQRYNFHGQNTSRWKYAGAIVVQNGEVSTHH
jgi:hypothetical protein